AGLRPDADVTLNESRLETLDTQMRALVQAQLDFEQLKREIVTHGSAVSASPEIGQHLEAIEKHLNRVIKDWEAGRPSLAVGVPIAVLAQWPDYTDFVADASADRLADNPAAAFRAVEEAVLRGFDDALPITAPP